MNRNSKQRKQLTKLKKSDRIRFRCNFQTCVSAYYQAEFEEKRKKTSVFRIELLRRMFTFASACSNERISVVPIETAVPPEFEQKNLSEKNEREFDRIESDYGAVNNSSIFPL